MMTQFILALMLGMSLPQALFRVMTPATAATSNIVMLQDVACNNAATHAAYSCSLSATGSGQSAVIVAQDFNGLPSAPTDSASDTFTNAFSIQSAHGNGYLDYWCGAISSGVTSVTLNTPASGSSNGQVRVYSGLASGCPVDVKNTALFNAASPASTTYPILGAQDDLAVAGCIAGVASPGYGALDDYANLLQSVNSSIANAMAAADIVNGLASYYSGNMSTSAAGNECAVVAFKSAVAGTAPSGNLPTSYTDFETGQPNGTALTLAMLNSTTHGGGAGWWKAFGTGNNSGFTTSTTSTAPLHQVTVNGKTYTASQTLNYLMTTSPTNYVSESVPLLGESYLNWMGTVTLPSDLTSQQDWVSLTSGSDHIQFDLNLATAKIGIECQTVSVDSTLSVVGGEVLIISMQFNATGTGNHTLNIYNSSGTLLDGPLTCAVTGTSSPSNIEIGQAHASPATSGTLSVAAQEVQFSSSSAMLVP